MKLVRGIRAWQACRARGNAPASGTATTIGNFDGMHLGHSRILTRLGTLARERGLDSVLLSFDPLPQQHFFGEMAPRRLQGLRNRSQSVSAQGIDYLMLLEFNDALAQLTPERFIQEILVDTLQTRHLIIGDDFRFGRNRTGDINTLRDASGDHGFSVKDTDTVDVQGARVSSTRVRHALANNELEQAAQLLGRPYRIDGRVVHGEKVGRQLGFPTANVALQGLRPPLQGVFAVLAIDLGTGTRYPAVANLGERPTIGGRRLLLEVHLLDASLDLYGHYLAINFLHFIRGEQRFESLDQLKVQIASDADAARALLN